MLESGPLPCDRCRREVWIMWGKGEPPTWYRCIPCLKGGYPMNAGERFVWAQRRARGRGAR